MFIASSYTVQSDHFCKVNIAPVDGDVLGSIIINKVKLDSQPFFNILSTIIHGKWV